ncbi:DNA ligase 1 [Teleopsis dalmanni]|uniref:DNA ligase 1 n=1 Tax=Teleopsis dalmanni TaxID=139649 RepID=UPI0018CF9572|nr:DNA ligase 1 [Teleopsis dalmanni]
MSKQKSITSFFRPVNAIAEKESPKCEIKKDSPKKVEETTKTEVKDELMDTSVGSQANTTAESPKSKSEQTKENRNMIKISDGIAEDQCDSADYNPAKNDYDPIKDAFWKKDKSTPYLALAQTFEAIENTRSRLKMIDILGNFFYSVLVMNPEDLLPSVYLSVNGIAPAYEGMELGVAETTLMKVICKATGRELKHIKAQTFSTGDLGIVAEQSRVAQRRLFQPAPLTIKNVFNKLKTIAATQGKAKSDIIQEVFIACRNSEARFFIRSLIGKLRIGIAEQSLVNALATAVVKSQLRAANKSIPSETVLKKKIDDTALVLRTAFCQCPNYDIIIGALLKHGVDELLEHCTMRPGIPIKPMLAQPTKSIHEVIDRLEGMTITCEWKYDGERAQIHCNDKKVVNIFSRNQENNTDKYPDVISRVDKFVGDDVRSFIIDSEVVAWDNDKKQILPFQILSTRKRKRVEVEDIKVQVCAYVFDLLYLNGKSLVTETFETRRGLMREHFKEVEGIWKFATAYDTNDINEIQQFLSESVKGNCEGLMVKTLDKEATYEIAKRSRNWLKLKKDYLDGAGDSLDLVVIGGFKGKGKRTGIYGGFLLACYDKDNEEYQSICKIGTGFTEEDLKMHADFFKDHVIKTSKLYYQYDNSLAPDDWFEPVQVWEVKCADLSLSPVHKAAIGMLDPEKGISLRFPRFIRIRDDKSPEDATSAQQVADMYSSQDQIKNQQNAGEEASEFYDDF